MLTASLFSLISLVKFLLHHFILFNEENDLTAVAVETGNVAKIRRILMLGKKITVADNVGMYIYIYI